MADPAAATRVHDGMDTTTSLGTRVDDASKRPNGSSGDVVFTALSTPQLEARHASLRQQAAAHSQSLTQKLATSQSGQNLLHMGSSLSTLPPDLHTLLTQLHPLLSSVEQQETNSFNTLQQLVSRANAIGAQQRRVQHSIDCADLYQDLQAAERNLQHVQTNEQHATISVKTDNIINNDDDDKEQRDLDYALSLERAAHTTLCLVQDLQLSTKHHATALTTRTTTTDSTTTADSSSSSSMPLLALHDDSGSPQLTERAEFVMALAPRIRRLEQTVSIALLKLLEQVLQQQQQRINESDEDQPKQQQQQNETELIVIGHCLRGLALLGQGNDAESLFARVAIMPLIRSQVSMGRLDQGGSRGECAGLFSLMDQVASNIAHSFGTTLQLAETMHEHVDLVTAGVWVPLATALLADPAIKMAIFSPGIANILQANYMALDTFLSELAGRLLNSDSQNDQMVPSSADAWEALYYRPSLTAQDVQRAQDRIYAHPKTVEFSKKWNLPIYYQLRFGESCLRLNQAIDLTQVQGWGAEVYTGSEELQLTYGFELQLFQELFDVISSLWRPDVILRPLTHRFLRGAVQLMGRVVAFVCNGLEGKIMFGREKPPSEANGENSETLNGTTSYLPRDPYCWGENLRDVASVAWDMTVLESRMNSEYVSTVLEAVVGNDIRQPERDEMTSIVTDVLAESSQQISPVVEKCWNEIVVNILTGTCCGPLAAVKGVAATYRMTNRPPPTQASPFVATILRPLKEFDHEFKDRNPPSVGLQWKTMVVSTVASRYSVAVEDLLTTVERTEEALKNRRTARRAAVGGMSDGEKVKLQLYLDYLEFSHQVEEVGGTPDNFDGVVKLKSLTIAGEKLYQQMQNGS